MKCMNCQAEIKEDDNFCHNCGQWTAKGFEIFRYQETTNKVINGRALKKKRRFFSLIVTVFVLFLTYISINIVKQNSIFSPFFYLEKKVTSFFYGYNTSIVNTDKIYEKEEIYNTKDAKKIITFDADSDAWKCTKNVEVSRIEYALEKDLNIEGINFCDINLANVKKIDSVIRKMYALFPGMEGALTNITITNAKEKNEYIARFQPKYQFVNTKGNKNSKKVNKTQVLLNSYYYLNTVILNQTLTTVFSENNYVAGANWESIIAHELGHYISFKVLLNENNMESIILETSENKDKINNIVEEYESGQPAERIVNAAMTRMNYTGSALSFALKISKYAATEDAYHNLVYDEIIAEAVHDYYLHGNSASSASLSIVEVLKEGLKVNHE